MIEKISNLDKQQYANIANFFTACLEKHPFAEMDDDTHRTIRMAAKTYISLYENFLELYTHVAKMEYITDTKKMH